LSRIHQEQELIQPADQARATYDIDDTIDQLRADYDTTPYNSVSYPPSAPGHLAAVAYLFGLETPDVSNARVLEIGCAAGGNVIPYTAAHPRAHIVGIDLSPAQIDQGRLTVQALDLDNVELLAGDIAQMDLGPLGQFDYVIAHGVYSWVPAEVQDGLLSAVRTLLAPDGVAYMSYNVYPGWKSKEIARDAMLLASGASATPEARRATPAAWSTSWKRWSRPTVYLPGCWPNSGRTLKVSVIPTSCTTNSRRSTGPVISTRWSRMPVSTVWPT
jgi:SAM-dependent methyltransferase